ncbi:MAG: hypothetical protein QM757_01310 [Paludibaculum sp.]
MTAQLNAANSRMGKMDELMKPAIDVNKTIVSGGADAISSALSIPLTNLAKAQKATEGSIADTMPEGPAKDFAMLAARRDANSNVAGLKTEAYNSALDKLLNIGQAEGATGLQQMGAGVQLGRDAGVTNNALMDAAAKRKSATMGAIGAAAGLAGTAATGGFKKGKS